MVSQAPVFFIMSPDLSSPARSHVGPPGDRAACHASGEDAAAQKGAFESAQSMHAAAAEARRLHDREQTGDHPVVGAQNPALQIGLDTAQALTTDDEFADRD